ncbi:Mbov_0397 family ICE element conjugal transfer ATPase [Spiroplasma endosymbiont of Labia minor]|uniref:Mbov_0397 family ICE element conjugal transfer ATPase n=1 Tax=Spiroplasma endosymbiont of Labia minor TaxID=3066305 RepID=UPI0030CA908B
MGISIIPPNSNKHKLKIKGNLTLIDFIALFLICGLSALIGWSIYEVTNLIGSIIISILIAMLMSSFLLPSKKYKKRIYQLCWEFLKWLSSNRKMTVKNKNSNNDTVNLFAYKKIHDNFIETDIKLKNKSTFIGGLKLDGFNLNNLSIDEQDIKINQFKNVLDLIDVNLSIIKINNCVDMLDNKMYINNKLRELEDENNLSVNQIKAKKEQLKGYLELHNEYKQSLDSVITIRNEYYILFYAIGVESANIIYSNLSYKLDAIGLKTKQLNGFELVGLVKNLFDPYSEKLNDKEITKFKHNLKELFSFENVEFKKESVVVKNDNDELHINFTAVDEYPKYPNRTWLLPLMQTDSTVILNIENVTRESFTKEIDKLVSNVESNIYNTDRRKITNSREQQNDLSMYNALIDEFSADEEQIKKINLLFITCANSKQELKMSLNSLRNNLKENHFEENRLLFMQLEGFSACLPKITDPLSINLGRAVPTTVVAESFPFVTSDVKDVYGAYIGTDELGNPLILDLFLRTKTRKNHNMVIMGIAGSGKSTLLKKILNWHVSVNRKVIIIDPEREYKDLCTYHNGSWINAGDGSKNRINPLQVMLPFQDEDSVEILSKETREEIISSHLSRLEEWIKILYPELEENIIRYFSKLVGELYNIDKFKKVNYDSKSNDFPIFDDLVRYMENKIELNQLDKLTTESKIIHINLLELIKNEFTNFGKYKVLYNGYSSVDIANNNFIVFDINSLVDNNKKIQAQLYLITAFIQNEVRKVGFRAKNEIVIAIDEAHLLIDKDNPIALNFIYQTTKRIRKYRGSMILATQNPEDFNSEPEIAKKTKAMMNNVQYSVIMNLSPENTKAIVEMYRGYGNGLSSNEIDIISHAQTGEGLLFVSGFDRHKVNVRLLDSEKKAIGRMGGVSEQN